MILNAKAAIARHMQWRMTLQFAIATREPLPPDQLDQIRHDERCAIGMWLRSSATEPIRHTPEFADLDHRHFAFHREMEKIAGLIGTQRFAEAAEAMNPTSSFAKASREIAMAIVAIDRAIVLAIPTCAVPRSSACS